MTPTQDLADGASLLRTVRVIALALAIAWCCAGLTVPCQAETAAADADATQPPADPAIVAQLAQLRAADVAADLAAAWKAHDQRYLGVLGIGMDVPGFDQSTMRSDDEVRVIPNTSDCPRNDTEAELDHLARTYARIYNTLLTKRLAASRAQAEGPADPPADPHRPVFQDSLTSRMP